jgi:hypothetical protein
MVIPFMVSEFVIGSAAGTDACEAKLTLLIL